MKALPIDAVLPKLKEVLRSETNAVLVAPPGAGKTTRVPLALVQEDWLGGRRILMLEPRRLAARAAARFMAHSLGEEVGEMVGYRVRMDSKVGPATRIEVVTEGVLTRMLQEDPALEGVGAVLFDEYHERSLQADLGLALCLQSQLLLREDLRLIVMSATLEAEPVAALLGDAPVIESEGRMYPVDTRYRPRRTDEPIEAAVSRVIEEVLRNCEGDVLVFLPGAPEIRRVESRLAQVLQRLGGSVRVLPLYGSMPQEAQDRAIEPGSIGERKVVLATSIAETSLTVEGVRVVVDSGLSRVPRFSPRTGMTRLATVPVSRASADQRRGRAGREGPGVCFRLWTEQEELRLPLRSTPELLEADLAPLALELAAWGAAPEELLWLDPPPAPAMAQALELLHGLGALDGAGVITPHGKSMARLGIHPRLAHMMLQAVPLGLAELACELAAILGERDFLRPAAGAGVQGGAGRGPASGGLGRGGNRLETDLFLRVDALRHEGKGEAERQGWTADPAVLRRLRMEAGQLRRGLSVGGLSADRTREKPDAAREDIGLLLAFAYPDRIGQLRSAGRFLLRNGRGAVIEGSEPLAYEAYLVAAELDDTGAESRIYLAAAVRLDQLERAFQEDITQEETVIWDSKAQGVRARRRVRLGALTLREGLIQSPNPDLCLTALMEGIREEGLRLLPWSKAALQLRERLFFMHRADPSWPDASDDALLGTLPEWLGPHLYGCRSKADLDRLPLAGILEGLLTWNQKQELDAEAPTHLRVPSGSRIPVDYSDPEAPVLAVRLQELFGLQETPRIGLGRIPMTIHLLSPAGRPVQVTRDLASFWRTAYFDVKKDLKGRYPKHYWPDDPMEAIATHRVRPRPDK